MVYVTGDIHGDISRFAEASMKKLKKEDILIVCGDFGFLWTGDKKEKKVLEQLSKLKFSILFVDGEHENFDILNKCENVELFGGESHRITENIHHLKRGQIYNIDGKKIFTFGGGESADKEARFTAGTWWECELPTINEMKFGVNQLNAVNRTVDFVITHEPPAKIKRLITKSSSKNTNALNAFFDDLSEKVSFNKWFFGAMHIDKNISVKHRAVFLDVLPMYE